MKCVEVFKEFYQTKTKHRKLTWIYSLGTCNITGKFDAKPIELIVTTYQVLKSGLLRYFPMDPQDYETSRLIPQSMRISKCSSATILSSDMYIVLQCFFF